jgi:DNA-binding transcriptional ArsR family regulator
MTVVEDVLTALADPTRRDLLEQISRRGDATATVLAQDLPITRQAVVQHLAVLDAAGLVVGRHAGREHRFELRTERLSETAKWMQGLVDQWDQRLAAIRDIAERELDPPLD